MRLKDEQRLWCSRGKSTSTKSKVGKSNTCNANDLHVLMPSTGFLNGFWERNEGKGRHKHEIDERMSKQPAGYTQEKRDVGPMGTSFRTIYVGRLSLHLSSGITSFPLKSIPYPNHRQSSRYPHGLQAFGDRRLLRRHEVQQARVDCGEGGDLGEDAVPLHGLVEAGHDQEGGEALRGQQALKALEGRRQELEDNSIELF